LLLVISIVMSNGSDENEATTQPKMDIEKTLNSSENTKFPTMPTNVKTIEKKSFNKIKPLIKKNEVTRSVVKKTNQGAIKNTLSTAINTGDILLLHVTDQSWAKIEDADGQRLFYATLMPGEEYQFKGQSPFKIFLGNAPAVQLSVNHQDVDLKAYIKSNNIAQITIDETATIQ